MVTLKVNDLIPFLMKLYEADIEGDRYSVLLIGPPGIGKSFSVKRFAQLLAKKKGKIFIDYDDDIADEVLKEPQKFFVFHDLRLVEIEPSDLIGIPEKEENYTKFNPLKWARIQSLTEGVLLLDELTNVTRPDVISVSYKPIFDHKTGYIKFSRDFFVIAAGNAPEHSSIASMLPAPLINRCIVIRVRAPTVDEWEEFMEEEYGDRWDKRTFAFLKAFEGEGYILKVPRQPECLDNYPTPRTWTKLATIMYKWKKAPRYLIEGLIGPEIGQKFWAFSKTRIDLKEYLQRPMRFLELKEDQRFMLCLLLATWIKKHIKDVSEAFSLLDVMRNCRREYLVVTALCLKQSHRPNFLIQLFKYNDQYREILEEIAFKLKQQIQA